jgi:hypothetical protein
VTLLLLVAQCGISRSLRFCHRGGAMVDKSSGGTTTVGDPAA